MQLMERYNVKAAGDVLRISLFLLFFALLLVSQAARADLVTFKEEAFVKGPKVLLGDIANIEGEAADELAAIELIDAARPGSQKRLQAALVEARLRNAGYDTSALRIEGPSSIVTTTLSSDVSREAVAESLMQYIKETMPWDLQSTQIEVTAPNFDVTVPEGVVDIAWSPAPDYRYVGAGAFRGELVVDGVSQRNFTVRAKVEPYVEVLVASRDIARGQALGPVDFEPRKMPLSAAPSGALTDPDQALGLVARKTIFPGEYISERDLQERVLVQRNQTVNAVVRAGAVTLNARLVAMADGRAGDAIPCVNPGSKEQVLAMVMPDGTVQVE